MKTKVIYFFLTRFKHGFKFHIPDLMEESQPYNNIILTAGGINECLKEVEIALTALNKPYSTYSEFTY